MQKVFISFGYPICIISVLSASIFLLENGYTELEVLLFGAISSIFFTVIGEIFIPLFKDWRPSFKENFFPDASLFVLNYIVFQSQLLQIFLASIAMKFSGGGFDLWPSGLNIYVQLVFALIIAEFGLYWFHRGCHEIPFLWRFHRIHHNPKRLYWFNATRFHYVDVTLLQVCGIVPLLILGADAKIISLVTIFSTVHGFWQHVNAEQDQKQFKLSAYDAQIIASSKSMADFFESAANQTKNYTLLSNWLIGEVSAYLNKELIEISESKLNADNLAMLINRIDDQTISGKIGKTIFEEMCINGTSPDEIIESKGLKQISDDGAIEQIINTVIKDNSAQVKAYLEGKDKLFGFFVGQVMKLTQGKANPTSVNTILKEKLKK